MLGLCAAAGHVEEGGVVEEEPVGEAGLVVLAQPPILLERSRTDGRIFKGTCACES